MRTNESIIAVPISVEQQGQTRQFLVRLVERLDIVLGYRGGDPYVALSQLQSITTATDENLTKLEQTVLDIITSLFSENDEVITQLLEGIVKTASGAIDDLKSPNVIGNADASTQTISNPPTQIEVQNIQNQVRGNANDFNSLLTALRGTGIIAT